MEYPSIPQEVFDISQLSSFQWGGSYDLLPCFHNHQCSHINPICNSVFSLPSETWDNASFSEAVPGDSLLRIQPAVQSEYSGWDQDLKQVVSNLEGKIDKLAELIENLRNE